MSKIITCLAPVNIAVIKYWGKKDENLIIPINDSLSATLSSNEMHAKTTVMISPDFTEDKIWLNGKEESFSNDRLKNCLEDIKKRAITENKIPFELLSWKIHVCSENNFPTAAGLASSAAGYACLVFALSQLYSIASDISTIARRGSGSACRSIYGGWVRWYAGCKSDGTDSIAKQIAPSNHWPDMRVIILVINDNKKRFSSKTGMNNSVTTSELLKHRAEHCVPARIKEITKAILDRDFEKFGRLTIQDSNQFHAVCLDTYPPCIYMNDISHEIVYLVHKINEFYGSIKLAYTFDAGPNACIYLLQDTVPLFLSILYYYFPTDRDVHNYMRGIKISKLHPISEELIKSLEMSPKIKGLIKYIICTKVGEGPELINDSNAHLLNENGLPKI